MGVDHHDTLAGGVCAYGGKFSCKEFSCFGSEHAVVTLSRSRANLGLEGVEPPMLHAADRDRLASGSGDGLFCAFRIVGVVGDISPASCFAVKSSAKRERGRLTPRVIIGRGCAVTTCVETYEPNKTDGKVSTLLRLNKRKARRQTSRMGASPYLDADVAIVILLIEKSVHSSGVGGRLRRLEGS